MNVLTKAQVLFHILRWRLTWNRRDTRQAYTVAGNPKFMGPRDAVKLIRDGDFVAVSGLGSTPRASIMYWAIQEMFKETGHPRDLSIMAIGGFGGRGKAPGTTEELGVEGLAARFIGGHLETFKSFTKLADSGKLEIQCLPQGTLAFLIDGQARGEDSFLTGTGVGTFMDPRVGRGTPMTPEKSEQWVKVEGDQLRYRIPKIDAAVFNVPAADREGNLYVKNCAMFGETREIALAARRNGGHVIANVGLVVDKGYSEIFLPAELVDAVVVWPGTEQVGSVPHRRYWPMFTLESKTPLIEGVEGLRFANQVLGITPRRSAADVVLARLAASIFAENLFKGAFVNVGIGLPEEMCRLLAYAGIVEQITLFTESGVVGGLPTPGVFFGTAISPREIISAIEIFKRCYENLDATALGVLQADSFGNVNVSKRGEGIRDYVGPGGFIDFTTAAKKIFFISSWMAHGRIEVAGDKLRVVKRGTPKFIKNVDEITFCGPEALKNGKQVFYITHVGVFRLTERGMELTRVMPGIDIQKDILDFAPMHIVLPESGEVPVVDPHIVTGEGFKLELKGPGAGQQIKG